MELSVGLLGCESLSWILLKVEDFSLGRWTFPVNLKKDPLLAVLSESLTPLVVPLSVASFSVPNLCLGGAAKKNE